MSDFPQIDSIARMREINKSIAQLKKERKALEKEEQERYWKEWPKLLVLDEHSDQSA